MRNYLKDSSLNGKLTKIVSEDKEKLTDGREVHVQTWSENDLLFTTYFFSTKDLEEKSKEELFYYLQTNGIQINEIYSNGKVRLQKFFDKNKQLCWGLTVVDKKIK